MAPPYGVSRPAAVSTCRRRPQRPATTAVCAGARFTIRCAAS